METTLGLNLFAHFCYPAGLQQSAFAIARGLRLAGIPVSCRDVSATPFPALDRSEFLGPEIYDFTMFQVQPGPPLDMVGQWSGVTPIESKYRIGYWFWESNIVPPHWIESARRMNVREVWTASRYAADILRRALPAPVYLLPHGLEIGPFDALPDSAFGLPDDRFTFLFMFDMRSSTERKNPFGLIQAFRAAFTADEPVQLVIRAHHPEQFPGHLQRLKSEARRASNIDIVERPMSREESYALLSLCDCYVSLHRSEGFGLTMAEAMLLGKPVIATGYSGNIDFMTEDNSYLVSYELAAHDDIPLYPPRTVWATPSTEHAAGLMRHVYENPDEARSRAGRGQREAAEKLSLAAAGQRMANRLRAICSERGIPSLCQTR